MVLVDNTINCLFEPEIPSVIFMNPSAMTKKEFEEKSAWYASRGEIVT
jgi:hypothetical protein